MPCSMSNLRNDHVTLLDLRNDHVTLLDLRNDHVLCDIIRFHISIHYSYIYGSCHCNLISFRHVKD